MFYYYIVNISYFIQTSTQPIQLCNQLIFKINRTTYTVIHWLNPLEVSLQLYMQKSSLVMTAIKTNENRFPFYTKLFLMRWFSQLQDFQLYQWPNLYYDYMLWPE